MQRSRAAWLLSLGLAFGLGVVAPGAFSQTVSTLPSRETLSTRSRPIESADNQTETNTSSTASGDTQESAASGPSEERTQSIPASGDSPDALVDGLGFEEPLGGSFWVVCIVGLMVVAVMFWRRRVVLGHGSRAKSNLQLVGTLPLGDKRAIALVQAEGEKMLVGITPQQVNLLCRLEGRAGETPLLPFPPSGSDSAPPPTPKSFASWLQLSLGRSQDS